MNEYTYIIFDHKGKRLGKIEFGKRISVPSASEIEEAIKDGFPNGATYKLIVPINVCIYPLLRYVIYPRSHKIIIFVVYRHTTFVV